MNAIILQVLLLASIISCAKENNVDPEKLFIKLIPSQRFVKVNDSIPFSLYVENHENFQLEYEWTSDKGKVDYWANNGKFYAPAKKDDVTLHVKVKDQFGNVYKDSTKIIVYNQFVILKADDLVNDYQSIFPDRWNRFIEYIEKKELKASIGIIANSLELGNQAYFDKIKSYHNTGNIEFWNHGYGHLINALDANGEKWSEFKNSPIDYQKEQLKKAQSLAKNNLGFYFRSFGAPGNAIDNNTMFAIEADSTVKVWFYGNQATTKMNLRRHSDCEIEYPVHHPNFEKFKTNYDPFSELLVLQIHPNSWDDIRFDEFYQVIEHLLRNEVTFVNPYEYYRLVNDVIEEMLF